MGQYFIPVNMTKKQFIYPHKLGCGLKLYEQIDSHPGTGAALVLLLSEHQQGEHAVQGSWCGDTIKIVGDYGDAETYNQCRDDKSGFKDITDEVCKALEKILHIKYVGEGWRDIERE